MLQDINNKTTICNNFFELFCRKNNTHVNDILSRSNNTE